MSETPIKIWYQGFTHPVINKNYVERLQAHLDGIAGPGVSVAFNGVEPPASHLHALEEFRCAARAMQNALRAEEEGFDALVLGHFQEAGLAEIRAMLDIPALGLGECSMLYACTIGRRFGLVTINPVFIPWHEDQIVRAGLSTRSAGVRAMTTTPDLFMQAFVDDRAYDGVLGQFRAQAQPLLDAGADVLIPAGGLPMLLFARENGLVIDHAPVVNGINVLVAMASAAVRLKRIDGLSVSRRSNYARPSPAAVSDFLGMLT